MKRVAILAILMGSAAPAQPVAFSPEPTGTCLAQTGAGGGEACVGRAAEACIAAPDGGTTVGMAACYDRERQWWDTRLNDVYTRLVSRERANEAEARRTGIDAPPTLDPLRTMQRTWIEFRDAVCDYERATWGGGTGGGPATVACLMRETAAQALRLEARLSDLEGR